MRKRLINLTLRMFARLFPSERPLLLTGTDSSKQLVSLARAAGAKRTLLVTEKALVDLGLLDGLLAQFENEGIVVTIFDGIIPNPTYKVIKDGIDVCNASDSDSVFVVGGGSAIDAAKVIAACSSARTTVEEVVGLLKVKSVLPFYVVPTTSGTGSEVTNAAVISETETHQKKFVVDPKLIPAATALDPKLIKSLPPHITAATGMDALTHAIEAYTSVNRFVDAERDAKLAVKLLTEYLPQAHSQGENLEAREQVAIGSFLAGYAFNKSGLGYVHAISHQVSAHYNTPHGLANAVILPRVLRFIEPVATARLANLERTITGSEKGRDEELASQFIERIEALGREIGIPAHLEELQEEDFAAIAANARKEAMNFYAVPRLMSAEECTAILADVAGAAEVAEARPNAVPNHTSVAVTH